MSTLLELAFQSLYDKLVSKNDFTPSLMTDFFGLLGEQFIDAYLLIDSECIRKLLTPSGKFLIEIGDKGKLSSDESHSIKYHYCCVNANYCSCISYQYNGLNFDKILWCKHLLASKLALAIDEYQIMDIKEEEFEQIWRSEIFKI